MYKQFYCSLSYLVTQTMQLKLHVKVALNALSKYFIGNY